MIIENGTMQAVLVSGSGYDEETGNPIAQREHLGEPVPVNISGKRSRYRETNGVSYTKDTCEVLSESVAADACDIILFNSRRSRIGRYRVLDVQHLDCVDAVRIIAERYAD